MKTQLTAVLFSILALFLCNSCALTEKASPGSAAGAAIRALAIGGNDAPEND